MIQEFQKLLQTPKPTNETYLKMMQDTILNTMQQLMPQNFDFGQLAGLFNKQNQNQNIASVTYKLTQFFVRVISQHFISLQSYFSLQQQTQKLQSTIRSHIKVLIYYIMEKMQQQMKMYLQHLEYKIQRYEFHIKKLRKQHHYQNQQLMQLKQFKDKDNIEQLKRKQTQLMKERLILLRKVDHLERKIKDQEVQLRRLNSPTSATIQQIKDGINRQRQLSTGKIQIYNQPFNNQSLSNVDYIKQNIDVDRRMSTNSFGSDNQVTQKKTSIPINTVQTHRLFSTNGKDSTQVNTFISIQNIQTKKQIQIQQNKQSKDQSTKILNQQYQDPNSPIQHLIRVQ